jgi:predicted nucleic acid-binding protein
MSRYLIDTNWIIDALHRYERATQTLVDLAPDGLDVSLITFGELYEGAYYARDPQKELAGLTAFLQGKDLLPLTVTMMERFGILRGQLTPQQRRQVGELDLLIAATALTHELALLTRNLADFELVPGRRIYSST